MMRCSEWKSVWWKMVLIIGGAAAVRLSGLGNPFPSSDNAELAVRIISLPGYAWIMSQEYGAVIALYVKLFVSVCSVWGIPVTEFLWKLPVAVIGVMHIPLTYLFLRRMGAGGYGSVWGAMLVSVFPLHVFMSRYMWGAEVLGAFFVTIALWSFLDFMEKPTWQRGIRSSACIAIYCASHVYFLPFIAVLFYVIVFYGNTQISISESIKRLGLCVRKGVWVFPLLASPLYVEQLRHIFVERGGGFHTYGWYIGSYLPLMIERMGIYLFLLSVLAIGIFIRFYIRAKNCALVLVCSIFYVVPIVCGAPPAYTEMDEYLLIGFYFIILLIALCAHEIASRYRKIVTSILIGCYLVTLWGIGVVLYSVRSEKDTHKIIGCITPSRGFVEDTGIKAAGYLLRTYVPSSAVVCSLHQNVEIPVLKYYCQRTAYAWNDMAIKDLYQRYHTYKHSVDVIITMPELMSLIDQEGLFPYKTIIEGTLEANSIVLYSKKDYALPAHYIDAAERSRLNDAYDVRYAITYKDII